MAFPDRRWRGTAAGIKYVLPLLFITSLAAWICGVGYTASLARLPKDGDPRPSTAQIFFYSSAVPMAAFLAAAVDILLYSRGLLHPVVSIVWGVIQYALWVYICVTWAFCEYSSDTGGLGCPKLYQFPYSYGGPLNDVYETGWWYGRIVAGALASALALTQMALGARAVDLWRKERKSSLRKASA